MRAANGIATLLLFIGLAGTIAAPILGEDAAVELGVEEFGGQKPQNADSAQLAPVSGTPEGIPGKAQHEGGNVASDKKVSTATDSSAGAANDSHAKENKDSSSMTSDSGKSSNKHSKEQSGKHANAHSGKDTATQDDNKQNNAKGKDAGTAANKSDKSESKDSSKDIHAKSGHDRSGAKDSTDKRTAPKQGHGENAAASNAPSETAAPVQTPGQVLEHEQNSLKKDARRAAGIKPTELREGYDEAQGDDHSETAKQPHVAKQPIVVPRDGQDDNSPMPQMPRTYPFSPREPHPDDDLDKNDPDPYKQRGTYTKEMKKMDKQLAWERANPVTENGQTRPWDDLNDFKDPNNKVATAKRIAQNIYHLTERQVAKKAEVEAFNQKLRKIKTGFRQSAKFLKSIIKASKREDQEDRRKERASQARAAEEKSNPSKAIKNRIISDLRKEDDALEAKLPTEPAPWAVQEVLKSAHVPGMKKPQNAAQATSSP